MNFKSIKIEKLGLDINKILKVTYNESEEDERVLFYDYDIYNKNKWEGDIFNTEALIEQIKKDLEHKYASNNK